MTDTDRAAVIEESALAIGYNRMIFDEPAEDFDLDAAWRTSKLDLWTDFRRDRSLLHVAAVGITG